MKRKRLVAHSPFLGVLGGGERYFLSALEALQAEWDVVLVGYESDPDVIRRGCERFGIDLSRVSVEAIIPELTEQGLAAGLRDYQERAAAVARVSNSQDVFFQLCNHAPLVPDCRVRITHQQTNSVLSKGLPEEVERVVKDAYQAQHGLFFPSRFQMNAFLAEMPFRGPAWFTHPPVAEVFFTGVSDTNRDVDLLCVGRLMPSKRVDAQVEAAARLMASGLSARMVIVAPLMNEVGEALRGMAQARGARLEFMIGISDLEVRRMYQRSKILLSTTGIGGPETYQEAFGLTVAEAMGSGCVPVATRWGGQAEIIDHEETGFLVSSIDELAAVLSRVLRDEAVLRAMQASAQIAARKFTVEQFRRSICERFSPYL